MEFSVAREALVFLSSAAAGAGMFLLYDLFRVIRLKSGAGQALIHVQDGVFWLLSLGLMFFVVFSVNNGTLRFYEILGAFLGAVFYGFSLSGGVLKILGVILDVFSGFFKVFLKILLTPLVFMYNIVYRCICLFLRPLVRLGRLIFRRIDRDIKRTGRMIKKQ